MVDTKTKAPPFLAAEEHLPVATFKNSLRQWQALWQAQQPADAPAAPRKTVKLRPRRGRKAARTR